MEVLFDQALTLKSLLRAWAFSGFPASTIDTNAHLNVSV